MTKLLPSNFELDRYGVTCRLVQESDAEFIVKLRSDPKLGRFLHASDGDVQKQIEWTREYKKREAEGLDYYFIFSKDGEDFGLCRIYNIDWTHLTFTNGSWVCKPGTLPKSVMLTSVITDEIAYDILGLIINIADIRKDNKKVVRFHEDVVGVYRYGETDLNYLYISTPETRKNNRLKKLLGIE